MVHFQGKLRYVNLVLVIHWKVLKIDKGWFSVTQLEIRLIWENLMMQHSHEGLEYGELEKNSQSMVLSKPVDALS